MIFLQVILPFRCWDGREISYTAVPSSKIKMLEEMSWSFVDQLYAQLGWCSSNNLHSLFHISKTLFWTCIHLSKLQSNTKIYVCHRFCEFFVFSRIKKKYCLTYLPTWPTYVRGLCGLLWLKYFFKNVTFFMLLQWSTRRATYSTRVIWPVSVFLRMFYVEVCYLKV